MSLKAYHISLATAACLLLSCGSAAGPLQDPTRPGNAAAMTRTPAHATGSWVLNSTLVGSGRRVAVINGRHVTEGDSIGTARVLRINKLDVLLQTPGGWKRLQLLPDIVKQENR